jgi:exodeoxyribonuclease V alpha subunit
MRKNASSAEPVQMFAQQERLTLRTKDVQESLRGTVERIVFRNEENGFTVARFIPEKKKKQLTIVGRFPQLHSGESLQVEGKWQHNKQYGWQLQVDSYQPIIPATPKGIIRYLSSGLIKGVGPHTAKSLVEAFGEETLSVIEQEPKRLLEVPGIGKVKARQIQKGLAAHKEIEQIMVALQGWGLSPTLAVKIYKAYGASAVQVVKNEPYRLADEIWGVGFLTADRIAEQVGISGNSKARLAAGIKYFLGEEAGDGHVYQPLSEFLPKVAQALEVAETDLCSVLEQLAQEKQIFLAPLPEDRAVYLAPYYYAECGVAKLLSTIGKSPLLYREPDLAEKVKQAQEAVGIQLAPGQRQAVEKAISSGVLVITGGPGTGKTTVVKAIIELLSSLGMKVALAAPTGRAAKRLREATGRTAKTIHRLLEFSYSEGGGFAFARDEKRPLSLDVLIVDEASMVDLLLMYNLLKAMPPSSRLILVGDIDQLPSVGAGSVLGDLIRSGTVAVVKLTEIFRQAQESMIIVNAHRINQGLLPTTDPQGTRRDFFFIQQEEPERIASTIVALVSQRLPRYLGTKGIEEIQVLTPMRKSPIGVTALNHRLQEALNPEQANKPQLAMGSTTFRLGDKVMQIRNNYQKFVWNGDIGNIRQVNEEDRQVVVEFPEEEGMRLVTYESAELDELVLAYATSVHKSQGSEFPAVVMPVSTQHYIMLQRNLLYTAITRAKELVVLVGTKKALAIAVRNIKPQERFSLLAERLQAEFADQNQLNLS